MKVILYIVVFVGMIGCSYNDFDPSRHDTSEPRNPNSSIADLRARYADSPMPIEGVDIVVNGYVTTTDKSDNFTRTFIIDDGTAAVEIMAGTYDLYTKFAMGQMVTVAAQGLVMGMHNGMLQIGYPSSNPDYEVGYIGHVQLINRYLSVSDIYQYVRPKEISVFDIKDEMLGRLVEVSDMVIDSQYVDSITWAVSKELSPNRIPKAGRIKFRTSQHDSIYVTTSGYASFAASFIPQGTIRVSGILSRDKIEGRMVYQLKMRDLNDVKVN